MAQEPIRVGIAGLGRSGWDIMVSLLAPMTEKYKIAAVWSRNPDRQKEAREKLGCRIWSKWEDLVRDEDLEVIIVTTPNHMHASNTIEALDAGYHVVCEKPMATSLAEADAMIAAAKRTGRNLTIFQNSRYRPMFRKVKEVVESGVLGRIVMIKQYRHVFSRRWDWQTLKSFGGGMLNNYIAHSLDMVLELVDDDAPFEIFCKMDKVMTLGDAEDHVKLVLKAPGQPTIDLEASYCVAYGELEWQVWGTRGGLVQGSWNTLKWKWFDPKDLPPRELTAEPIPDRSYPSEEMPWKPEEIWTAPRYADQMHPDFYADLYETIRNGAPNPVTPESVRKRIAIFDKCHAMCPV